MKAAQINEYGDTSVINVVDTDKPQVQSGQVLVEVKAAGLNPVDSMIRMGYLHQMAPLQFPATVGADIAGSVVAVGDGVE